MRGFAGRAVAGMQVPFPDIAPDAPYSFLTGADVVGLTPVHSSVPVSHQRLGPANSNTIHSLYVPLDFDVFGDVGSYRESNLGSENAENV